MKYKISGIRERTDYSFALKAIHEEADYLINPENGNTRKKQLSLRYDNKNGILFFSTEKEIDPFDLSLKLAKKGLELEVLEK